MWYSTVSLRRDVPELHARADRDDVRGDSFFEITRAARIRSSRVAIRCSSSACSFFASSYSAFSAMSPNSRATRMRSATSRRFSVRQVLDLLLELLVALGSEDHFLHSLPPQNRKRAAQRRRRGRALYLWPGRRQTPDQDYDLPSVQVDLRESWRIGPVEIPTRLVLAPMAGVSVQAFRRQGRRFGAGLVCSEMVSCAGLQHRNERTLGYLRIAADEHPLAIQIFGSETGDRWPRRREWSRPPAPTWSTSTSAARSKGDEDRRRRDAARRPRARVPDRRRRRGGGLGPGLREDAARPRERLADVPRRRPTARRGRRGVAHAPSALGQADVHRRGRPLADRRARRARRRSRDRVGRHHLARASAQAVLATTARPRSWSAARPRAIRGRCGRSSRDDGRADARGGRRRADALHARDRARARRAARDQLPEEVLRLVPRARTLPEAVQAGAHPAATIADVEHRLLVAAPGAPSARAARRGAAQGDEVVLDLPISIYGGG